MGINSPKTTPSVALSQVTSHQRSTEDLELESKPLPRLPRGWSRFCHEAALFLRTIGLGLVVTTLQGLVIKSFTEPKKTAIIQNRFSALLRSLIHALPIGIALMEIIVNWNGRFIGANFDKQTYLQFAAKAHEITVQASLGTVLLAFLRYEVTKTMGIPLGAFLGGVQFTQISYLWSAEFWSSVLSKQFRGWNKVNFLLMALLCTILAATSGPSSASLLIPRQNIWSLRSFQLSVNGTSSDIWPDSLDGSEIPDACMVINSESTKSDLGCPSNDFAGDVQDEIQSLFPNAVNESDHTPLTVAIGNTEFSYEKLVVSSLCFSSSRDQYCATATQEVFIPIMTNPPPLGADIVLGTEPGDFVDMYETIQGGYLQPYSIASCVRDTIQETSNETSLRFPRLSETASELQKDREIISITNLTSIQALGISGNISQYRTAWIDLPQDVFKTGTPGFVVVHPKGPAGRTNVTTCTLNAGWGSSRLTQHFQDQYDVFSTMTDLPASWPIGSIPEAWSGNIVQDTPDFASFSGQGYPQRRLQVTQGWTKFLNPQISLPGQNSTLIDAFFSRVGEQPSEAYIARSMSMFLANGLSRKGFRTSNNITYDSALSEKFCNDCLQFEIQRSISGWSYQLDGVVTKLAITVMILYCVLAVAHILYAAITGISSSAWDSVAELVALAMNSESTHVLQNTCAGIIGTKAFKTPVRILETTEGHLELCFGDGQESGARTSRLKVNEKYGRVATGKETKEN